MCLAKASVRRRHPLPHRVPRPLPSTRPATISRRTYTAQDHPMRTASNRRVRSPVHHAEFDRNGPADKEVRLGGLAPWRIRRLKAFVESHLSQPIRVADLSGAVGLSATHFSRAFGRSFGEPPHVYLIQRRIDRARHLMLTSDIPLSDLAAACGFSDQAHFCRLFRRHTGRTPAAWRRDANRAIGSSVARRQIASGEDQSSARPF